MDLSAEGMQALESLIEDEKEKVEVAQADLAAARKEMLKLQLRIRLFGSEDLTEEENAQLSAGGLLPAMVSKLGREVTKHQERLDRLIRFQQS